MDDDEVEYHLDHEQAQEAISWAVDIAATITLMYHEDDAENDEESLDKLARFLNIIERFYETMPEAISDAAHDLAVAAIDRAEMEEEIVEEFLEEIKDL